METRSRLNRKLEAIREKKIQSLNRRFERMDLKKKQQDELARKMKKSRCYDCKERGHAYWNCPLKIRRNFKGKEKMIIENDHDKKEVEYTQKYKDFVKVTGDYTVLGTNLGTWNEIWYVSNSLSKHVTKP